MPTTTHIDATFSVRNIGDRTDNSAVDVDDYTAEEDRLANVYYPGVVSPDTAFAATVVGGGTPWLLRIGSGTAKQDTYVVEGQQPGQGRYKVRLDDAYVEVEFDAAEPSATRTDEVYLVVADKAYDGGSLALPRLAYRKGDPGGAAPGPDPSWEAYALLWAYQHGPGDSALSSAKLEDKRDWAHVENALPAGIILPHAGDLVPRGFLAADGRAVSRAQYARLFAAIGTIWGAGNGTTTFNLPNPQRHYIGGRSGVWQVGQVFGAESVTLTVANLPAHTHSISTNTHAHGQNVTAAVGSQPGVQRRDYNSDGGGGIFPQGVLTQQTSHSHTIGSTGQGRSFSILPQTIVCRFIISC